MRKRLEVFKETRTVVHTAAFHVYRALRWYMDARLTTRWNAAGYRLPWRTMLAGLARGLFNTRTVMARVYDRRTGKQCGEIAISASQLRVFVDLDLKPKTTDI